MQELTPDAIDAYSIATIAGAPFVNLLTKSPLAWSIVFALFSLPAANLLINLGYVSGSGPVLTFARIAPIASGIGWALTWLIGERLYVRSLIAAQNLIYLLASLRLRLDWALDCNHKYNNEQCVEFLKENISHGVAQHQPDNNWPAQQFNRFAIRRVPVQKNISIWVPNAWYFDDPNVIDTFSLDIPAFSLSLAHMIIWISLYLVANRYRSNPGWFISRFCLCAPIVLFSILAIILTFLGFSFSPNIERDIQPDVVEKYPFVFFSEIHGFFHTIIALMDYSSAFTGILIFASSRIHSGNVPINAIALIAAQMVPAIILYMIKNGCGGHLARVQPAYESYGATDATFMFDTAAVCFATMKAGPLWAIIYYTAYLFYACIGPMIVFLLFIYNSFLEQFPFIERFSSHFLALLCLVFSTTGLLLCMPMGTSFGTLLQYVSQSAITQSMMFIVILFIYDYWVTLNLIIQILCWHNLDSDIRLMLGSIDQSLWAFFFGATSPIYTALLFTSVPAFIAAKLVGVFDFLMGGMDILKHIDYGTAFISSSRFINRSFGYGILFGPTLIIITFALIALYRNSIIYKMTTTPRLPPISHRLFNSLFKISYRTVLCVIFAVEVLFALILLTLFLGNAIYTRFYGNVSIAAAGNFRTILLIAFLTFHILSLMELRWALKRWDHSSRLNLYIAVATLEMACLNGYMLAASISYSWGLNYHPLLVVFVNTFVRGTMIALAIAIRWSMTEMSYPTRTRDATEIYDATADLDNELDHDDDAPIIYEMRRDVFT